MTANKCLTIMTFSLVSVHSSRRLSHFTLAFVNSSVAAIPRILTRVHRMDYFSFSQGREKNKTNFSEGQATSGHWHFLCNVTI